MDFNALVKQGTVPVASYVTSKGDVIQLPVVDGYGLPKFTGDESHAKQWVENCPSCNVPMMKLRQVKKGVFLPDVSSIGYGQCQSDRNVKAKIDQWIEAMMAKPELADCFNYQPAWFCDDCKALWGEVSGYWSRFKEKSEVLNQMVAVP